MKTYFLFWITQFFSSLGSSMSGYALSLWVYQQTGSALDMSLLAFASSLPNVLAVFAGPFADRKNRKTMILFCDGAAGLCTLGLLILTTQSIPPLAALYALCFLQAIFNTFQSPAADAATTSLLQRDQYARTAGLRSFGYAINAFIAPAAGGSLYLACGLEGVFVLDLLSCLSAIGALAFFISIPQTKAEKANTSTQNWLASWRSGFGWLKKHPVVLAMMVYMAGVNLINSIYQCALPVLILNRPFGSISLLSLVRASGGLAMCLCGALMMGIKTVRDPLRIITMCILISFGTENFLLAFARQGWVCVVAEIMGWVSIPIMNTALDVFYRTTVTPGFQGRIFAIRNTIQYSTIPAGSLLGGILLETLRPLFSSGHPLWLSSLFGSGTAGAAALLLFAVAFLGAAGSCASLPLLRHWQRKASSASF